MPWALKMLARTLAGPAGPAGGDFFPEQPLWIKSFLSLISRRFLTDSVEYNSKLRKRRETAEAMSLTAYSCVTMARHRQEAKEDAERVKAEEEAAASYHQRRRRSRSRRERDSRRREGQRRQRRHEPAPRRRRSSSSSSP